MTYKHWTLNKDEHDVLWLTFDREKQKMNTFSIPVLEELDKALDEIKAMKDVKAMVLCSGKEGSFIAGADIEQFTKVKEVKEAEDFIGKAHALFNKVENLKIPTVAMINGICLGGGCELALSCDYRVMDDARSAKIGLPEVKLGIFPGWGGSVRLPRLIGSVQAMGLMLTGRLLVARQAAKMGLVDAAVPARHLKAAALHYALKAPAKKQPGKLDKIISSSLMRKIIANKMRKQVASKKVRKEHYPAPYALIDNWEKYGTSNKAMKGEAKAVADLIVGGTAQNLIRVFFLQQELKGLGKGIKFKPKHIHVIGAGTMGGDIAAWCAFRGMTVTLQDREEKYIAPAIKRAAALYKKKLKKPELVQQTLDRLMPDVEGRGAEHADVVIEAIFENLEAKQQLFKDLEAKTKPDCVLASNTSSIPLDEINSVMKNPERLVGIHYFNPVAMMPLVEIVKGDKTSDEVLGKAIAFVRAIDKLPLPVKSHPGFLVNRILMPYLMESLLLFQEGVPAATIDKAALKFGMPMGPIELADKVGLDVCLMVAENLAQYFGGEVPQFLKDKVEAGDLGVKSGKGFYKYDAKGKPEKGEAGSSPLTQQEIIDRLSLRYINESVACLREGIIADSKLLDAGMIFGTGFAPFRGGPMHYVDQMGKDAIVDKLKTCKEKFGDRFTPDAGWKDV